MIKWIKEHRKRLLQHIGTPANSALAHPWPARGEPASADRFLEFGEEEGDGEGDGEDDDRAHDDDERARDEENSDTQEAPAPGEDNSDTQEAYGGAKRSEEAYGGPGGSEIPSKSMKPNMRHDTRYYENIRRYLRAKSMKG